MEAVVVPIVVALIGGPMMWLLRRLEKSNTDQHAANMRELTRVARSVERVDEKMDRLDQRIDAHLEWHVDHDWKDRVRGRRGSA
jgi:membrane protein required for beta-lactamase induction